RVSLPCFLFNNVYTLCLLSCFYWTLPLTDRYLLLINVLLLGDAFISHLFVVWLAEFEIAMDE
ncbi:hypothetical protein AB4347_19565, partial [Vibrio breoganii]